MDKRNNIPDELKNQTVNGKKRILTKELPNKIKARVEKKVQLKQKRLKDFVQVSLTLANAQNKQQELLKYLTSADESIQDDIKRGFKKLRLDIEIEYLWRFDGKGAFIGVYNPPKPKKN